MSADDYLSIIILLTWLHLSINKGPCPPPHQHKCQPKLVQTFKSRRLHPFAPAKFAFALHFLISKRRPVVGEGGWKNERPPTMRSWQCRTEAILSLFFVLFFHNFSVQNLYLAEVTNNGVEKQGRVHCSVAQQLRAVTFTNKAWNTILPHSTSLREIYLVIQCHRKYLTKISIVEYTHTTAL